MNTRRTVPKAIESPKTRVSYSPQGFNVCVRLNYVLPWVVIIRAYVVSGLLGTVENLGKLEYYME